MVIFDDPRLSDRAKILAGQLARSIVYVKSNKDGHVDTSYPALAKKLGTSQDSILRAMNELRQRTHIETQSLNRGGLRVVFLTRHQEFDIDEYAALAESAFVGPDGESPDEHLEDYLAWKLEGNAPVPHLERFAKDAADWKAAHPRLTLVDFGLAWQAALKRWNDQQEKREADFQRQTGKELTMSDKTYDRARRRLFQRLPHPVAS